MDIERLVKMANDISNFFAAESDRVLAVQGVVDHLHKFWEPRMRQAILTHYKTGGTGLSELATSAIKCLAGEQDALDQTGDG